MGILYDELLKKLFYLSPKTGDLLEIFRYEVCACMREVGVIEGVPIQRDADVLCLSETLLLCSRHCPRVL